MSTRGSISATAHRHAFRAWVRTHHPDVGGDLAEFVAGLDTWRRRPNPACGSGQVSVFRSRHGLWLLARWWQRQRRPTRRVQ